MDQSDEEQLERLKAWWRRNGPALLLGAAVAAAGLAAWWGYQTWQERTQQRAAGAYADYLEQERQDAGLEALEEAGQRLLDAHAGSGYAALTALRLAREQAAAGAYGEAAQTLGWLVEHAGDRPMAELARLRQARALAQEDPERALAALDGGEVSEGFRAVYAELRGDLLSELDRPEEAAEAYRTALDAGGLAPQSRELVRTKLQAISPEA
ncbi:YfgM family protein [Halorhodospira neutriphila]|uniref:Ancillary SecYEG translocon subunit/Cell division coordinator CpoB TPR domain-containing protein n=1 Tax=Halorhodospira neutriphila TaxID=168379 RepID=A0ABS1E720_9GAMM|nr:tetratricopeptide repeat protein [Halorhodospira neutriphila]MBK1727298.1 hypothetical protein [Halorhodospira neutriphila]